MFRQFKMNLHFLKCPKYNLTYFTNSVSMWHKFCDQSNSRTIERIFLKFRTQLDIYIDWYTLCKDVYLSKDRHDIPGFL